MRWGLGASPCARAAGALGGALARFKEVETDGELHLRCMAAAKGEMRIGRICFVGTWDQVAPFIFATGRVESTAAAG